MNSTLGRLINWFKSSSNRTKWIAGLVGTCVLGMAALFMLTSSPSGTVTDATHDPMASSPTLFLDVFLKLGGVLVVIVGAAFLLRRWQSGSFRPATRQLAIVESIRLSQRQALHIIRAGDKLLLIGATDQSLTLISPVELKQAIAGEVNPIDRPIQMDVNHSDLISEASGMAEGKNSPVQTLGLDFLAILKKKI